MRLSGPRCRQSAGPGLQQKRETTQHQTKTKSAGPRLHGHGGAGRGRRLRPGLLRLRRRRGGGLREEPENENGGVPSMNDRFDRSLVEVISTRCCDPPHFRHPLVLVRKEPHGPRRGAWALPPRDEHLERLGISGTRTRLGSFVH